nr:GNAT family N-acetyltransferase [Candidatus Sigynarchaeota archaeon]
MKWTFFKRKPFKFFLALLIPLVTLQLIGLAFMFVLPTTHDLEFDYIESYHLQGNYGWYEGYVEDYYEHGHYIADFSGSVAQVQATVSWDYYEWDEGTLANHTTRTHDYSFTYSTTDGHYIAGHDQDYNVTGENVWFHVPGGFSKVPLHDWYQLANGSTSCRILDDTFGITQKVQIWAGYLLPEMAIRLSSMGSFTHGLEYDNMDATFTDTYYFTEQGYLVQNFYHEVATGVVNYYSSQFTLDSQTHVLGASWGRELDGITYFWTYWFVIVLFAFITYGLYEPLRWTPRHIKRAGSRLIIQKGTPSAMQTTIDTPYSSILDTFIERARHSKSTVISVHDNTSILGMGVVEADRVSGLFFGPGDITDAMAKYAGVQYAFVQATDKYTSKITEVYDVYQISGVNEKVYTTDVTLIKPLDKKYVDATMKMIASEDSGRTIAALASWVKDALETDIAFVATIPINDDWARSILTQVGSRKLMPQIVGSEAIIGVGFAATSATTGWLYGLYVHPAFRNKDIGEKLAVARLSAFKQMGITTAITEIAEWNGPAKSIYARLDATPVGKMVMIGKKPAKIKAKVRRH